MIYFFLFFLTVFLFRVFRFLIHLLNFFCLRVFTYTPYFNLLCICPRILLVQKGSITGLLFFFLMDPLKILLLIDLSQLLRKPF